MYLQYQDRIAHPDQDAMRQIGTKPVVQHHLFWRSFSSKDPKPFPIWCSFSAFALHWRFSRRSMLSATWPSLKRDPW